MQGIALIQSEKVNLFEPRQLAVGAIILITGIGGNLALPDGLFPFPIPVVFPSGCSVPETIIKQASNFINVVFFGGDVTC